MLVMIKYIADIFIIKYIQKYNTLPNILTKGDILYQQV